LCTVYLAAPIKKPSWIDTYTWSVHLKTGEVSVRIHCPRLLPQYWRCLSREVTTSSVGCALPPSILASCTITLGLAAVPRADVAPDPDVSAMAGFALATANVAKPARAAPVNPTASRREKDLSLAAPSKEGSSGAPSPSFCAGVGPCTSSFFSSFVDRLIVVSLFSCALRRTGGPSPSPRTVLDTLPPSWSLLLHLVKRLN
jgi:hypothetical protein